NSKRNEKSQRENQRCRQAFLSDTSCPSWLYGLDVMPGKVAKIGTFSDWIGLFDEWRKEIGVNRDEISSFQFDTLFGAIETDEIQFGHFKGRRKWENLRQIPTQQMRDALLNMIVYQGDTEFASVEQQRYLFETAPTDWNRRAITRVM